MMMDDRHDVPGDAPVDGVNTEGPVLFSCFKYVYETFVPARKPGNMDEDDWRSQLREGSNPQIDIVSTGWQRGDVVLAERTKVYWFTFNKDDKDDILELSKTHTTPEQWVNAGYATVSIKRSVRCTVHAILTILHSRFSAPTDRLTSRPAVASARSKSRTSYARTSWFSDGGWTP